MICRVEARIGWGAFAEYRSLLLLAPVEVCENYSDLLTSLDNIDGRMRWANASEVGKGVYWAVRMAKDTESKPDILFITDGQEAPPIDPKSPFAMPDDVQPGQIHGWIVGAGGDTPQPIPHTDDDDHRIGYWNARDVIQIISEDGTKILSSEHLSALREPHLKALAERVGFDYMRLSGASLARPRFDRRCASRPAFHPPAGGTDRFFVDRRCRPRSCYWCHDSVRGGCQSCHMAASRRLDALNSSVLASFACLVSSQARLTAATRASARALALSLLLLLRPQAH